jgi:L-lysine 6-transaminase
MVGKRIDEVQDNVFHCPSRINSTWGGNLVDMIRGIKYLEIIRDEKLVENAAQQGERLLGGLNTLAKKYPIITNVRGKGLFVAFTLPNGETRNKLRDLCWGLDLATLGSGPQSVRFRPCLNVSAAEIDKSLAILDKALSQLSA